jgi:hypothetical protein
MKPAIQKPSRLAEARQRLDRAVARLESALDGNGGEPGRPLRPADRLRAAERENVTLKEINALVCRRLDTTIARLRELMKE